MRPCPQLDFSLSAIDYYCIVWRHLVCSTLLHFGIIYLCPQSRSFFIIDCFIMFYLFHFSAALVLSCSLGRKCSCIWQVLEVGFPGFSHFGKKRCRDGSRDARNLRHHPDGARGSAPCSRAAPGRAVAPGASGVRFCGPLRGPAALAATPCPLLPRL